MIASLSTMRARILALAVVGSACVWIVLSQGPTEKAPTNGDQIDSNAWKTAVLVGYTNLDNAGQRQICTNASGALVGATNTVVTAAHVILLSETEEDSCKNAELWVGYNFAPKNEYFVWWPANTLRTSEELDLAVLAVDLDAEPWEEDESIDFSELFEGNWPTLDVAPMEDEPSIGSALQLFSYPAIGGYSVTYTSGHLAGWSYDYISETLGGIMKLDMTIAGGSSGGGVLDSKGRLVGIAIQAGATRFTLDDEYNNVDWVECRIAADTNEDGLIDDSDVCVPVGGFLNGAVSLFPLRQFLIGSGVEW